MFSEVMSSDGLTEQLRGAEVPATR
jgi:hypothetical protein